MYILAIGGEKLKQKPGLQKLLQTWSKSGDYVLADNAIRAQASIVGSSVSSAKYSDGVHLLYPSPSSEQFAKDIADFDIVLVHGVGGDPLGTWRSGDNNKGR